jgi:hypothetical protein
MFSSNGFVCDFGYGNKFAISGLRTAGFLSRNGNALFCLQKNVVTVANEKQIGNYFYK